MPEKKFLCPSECPTASDCVELSRMAELSLAVDLTPEVTLKRDDEEVYRLLILRNGLLGMCGVFKDAVDSQSR